MTDRGTLEDRLRRTFQAVAELPVTPAGVGETAGTAPGRPRRSVRLVGGAVAAAMVLVVVAVIVAYGPRSSTNDHNPLPATEPPGQPAGHPLHAVLAPVKAVTPAVLAQTATILRDRLVALGDTTASVSVDHGSIDIAGASTDDIRAIVKTGTFLVRPVLCGAASIRPADVSGLLSGPLPACQAQFQTTAANLGIDARTGRVANPIAADPGFASYATTSPQGDDPSATVLLGSDRSAGVLEYPRFVLGPAELSGTAVASAQAQPLASSTESSGWSVLITLNTTGAEQWNVVAGRNFHQFLAYDLDGAVLSAPLVQPTNPNYVTFDRQIEFGNFSEGEAKGLAVVVGSGPLPVALTLQSLSTVSPALGPAPTATT